jgi:hypothetical protein
MPSFPNRCQHIKVNGTQCGSPALRRNRFCYFHKRHHEERIALHADRARRRRNVSIDLPVLEDANSIQVSLMQIMRLLVAGQIDGKVAGLLLYALQTASANLQHTRFEPYLHDVILDPAAVGETLLGEHIWDDSDFEEEEEEEEEEERLPFPGLGTSRPRKQTQAGMIAAGCPIPLHAEGRSRFLAPERRRSE